MSDEMTRAAEFRVAVADKAHDQAKAFRNKKRSELYAAECALDAAYFDLVAKRDALAEMKDR